MLWLAVSAGGYLLNAAAALIDKYLLRHEVPHPAAYAFAVGALGLLAFVLTPFGLSVPGPAVFSASMVAGILFTFALLLFYAALRGSDASRVVPFVGALTPVLVFALAPFLLGETLSLREVAAFLVILLGTFLISRERGGRTPAPGKQFVLLGIGAALLFALSHVLAKFVYLHHPFISGLIWRSVGGFLGALALLAVPSFRLHIGRVFHTARPRSGALFLLGQGSGAASFVLINYAFSLGSVALVNALAGLQYVFLFLAVLLLSRFTPRILGESLARGEIFEKGASILLICVGISILFL